MQMQIVRSNITRITMRGEPSGNGQSLRRMIKEATSVHHQWIGEWENSKPVTRKDEQELKQQMMKLAAEAGLI